MCNEITIAIYGRKYNDCMECRDGKIHTMRNYGNGILISTSKI
jgi:hypothetical protein